MVEAALRMLIAEAVAAAQAPLVAEVRALRAVVAQAHEREVSRLEYSRATGLSLDSVDRRIADGSLRARRIGRRVLIRLEAAATEEQIAALAGEAVR